MRIENAIIVRNKTRLEQLVERFNTKSQAKFYIEQSVQQFYSKNTEAPQKLSKKKEIKQQKGKLPTGNFDDYEKENDTFYQTLENVQNKLRNYLKTKVIDQSFLPNFLFSDNDLIIVLGQDGLVANTAKYVANRPIIAINPAPERFDGILLPFQTDNFEFAVQNVLNDNYACKDVTMAEAKLNDGQSLLAFNDFFIGPTSHISARYKITFNSQSENQSSSGIIVSTGAGSTGWLSSLFNMANGIYETFGGYSQLDIKPLPHNTDHLVFIVREPFQSKTSQTNIIAGKIYRHKRLILESHMPQNGIIFSDGIQSDFLQFNSGAIAEIGIAAQRAKLIIKN